MIWENRTRLDPTLRKLTHSDTTEENVHIEDIGANVSANGTPLNADNMNIFEKNIGTYGNDTYSSSSTYLVGQYTIYEGLLYKCSTEITTAEEFNPSHWTQVSLQSLIAANETEIANLIARTGISADNTYTPGLWLKGSTCIYNNNLYRSNIDITVSEPFTPAHWDKITSNKLINETNNKLNIREWLSNANYTKGRIVIYNGVIYVAIANSQNIRPTSESGTDYWSAKENIIKLIEYANTEIASVQSLVNGMGYHLLANSLSEGGTLDLGEGESIYNYKFLVTQFGATKSYGFGPIIPEVDRIQTSQVYHGSTNMEFFNAVLSITENGRKLSVASGGLADWKIATTGNTNSSSSLTALGKIYGVK